MILHIHKQVEKPFPFVEHMDLKPLVYNGRDEGIEVTLRTELRPGDDPENVAVAIQSLFPDVTLADFQNEKFLVPVTKKLFANIFPSKFFLND